MGKIDPPAATGQPTSVVNRRSSVVWGSSVRPVWTGAGWMAPARRASEAWRDRVAEEGDLRAPASRPKRLVRIRYVPVVRSAASMMPVRSCGFALSLNHRGGRTGSVRFGVKYDLLCPVQGFFGRLGRPGPAIRRSPSWLTMTRGSDCRPGRLRLHQHLRALPQLSLRARHARRPVGPARRTPKPSPTTPATAAGTTKQPATSRSSTGSTR